MPSMFQATPAKPISDDAETIIGAMVKITGTLTSDGDVRINGSLEKGEVVAKGAVLVGDGGVVKANIRAASCRVAGRVEGNIQASDGVEILGTGAVHGEISSGGRLVIEAGGVFIGKSVMEDRSGKALDAEIEEDLKKA